MHARVNVNEMSGDQLCMFRDRMRMALATGAFEKIAGDHAAFSPDGPAAGLVWNRRALARMEQALGTTMPFWDSASDPVPQAYLDLNYTDMSGNVWPNPLLGGRKPASAGTTTTRRIMNQFPTGQLADAEALALSRGTFGDFSSVLEDAQCLVQTSIGGDMGDLDYAAYDPLFWAVHVNTDRICYRWQTTHANVSYASMANLTLTDGTGSFDSLTVVRDLSGWQRTPVEDDDDAARKRTPPAATSPSASQPVVAQSAPSVVSANTATTGVQMLANGSALVQRSTMITTVVNSTTMVTADRYLTRTERRALPPKAHVLLMVPQVMSTQAQGHIDVMVESTCIAQVSLFGMGTTGHLHPKDHVIDVTFAFFKMQSPANISNGRDLEAFHSRLTFKAFNASSSLVANGKIPSYVRVDTY
ncbi:hypothetical protein PBRA_007087 [Plasmodiophora brassicae]|nr:hypothetical protein PBRA_007087 [Plasmodiophora brassicae]